MRSITLVSESKKKEKKRSGASIVAGYQLSSVCFVLTRCSWTQRTPRGAGRSVYLWKWRVGGSEVQTLRTAEPRPRRGAHDRQWDAAGESRAAVCLAELCCFKHGHEKKEKWAHLQCLQLKKTGVFAPPRFGLVWGSRAIFGGGDETVSSWL